MAHGFTATSEVPSTVAITPTAHNGSRETIHGGESKRVCVIANRFF
ncbi:MAG: hypothetical protein ABI791_14005 [Acidobacteriota bacterium]